MRHLDQFTFAIIAGTYVAVHPEFVPSLGTTATTQVEVQISVCRVLLLILRAQCQQGQRYPQCCDGPSDRTHARMETILL